jgi:TPP-dependent 2-oxoacid decarboxylase
MIPVKSIIVVGINYSVLQVNSSTEELDTIVTVGYDLNMIDAGSFTNRTKSKSVKLVVRTNSCTTMTDR